MEAGGSSVTEQRKDGPRAPTRRGSSKFAGAGRATTAVTAEQTEAVAEQAGPAVEPPAAVIQLPEAAPEKVQDGPKAAPGGEDTDERRNGLQSADEPAPKASEPEPEQATPEQAPSPPGIKLPDFARLQARSHTGMDPAQVAMYTRSLEVQFMQVSSSYRSMMTRQEQLAAQVAMARKAGFPEHLLEQLAVKHNWEVPEAVPDQ